MARTFAATQAGYTNMWNNASLLPTKKAMAVAAATKACSPGYKNAFLAVQAATGGKVPWWFIAGLLYRESDLSLNTYLGNGQSLLRPTTEVPANRGPFIGADGKGDFVAGALDALTIQGFLKYDASQWTIEFALYQSEEFNGEGYQSVGINSPYVWAGTNWEQGGLFVADHQLDRNAHDTRVGVAAIYACIAAIDPSILQPPTGSAQPTVVPSQPVAFPPLTTTVKSMANGGAGMAQTVGTATTTATPIALPIAVSGADLVKLTQTAEAIVTKLPMLAPYLSLIPGAAPIIAIVIPFVPVVDQVLLTLEKIEAAGGSWTAILGIIEADFANISAAISTARTQAKI